MSDPIALDRARAVLRHIKFLGGRPCEYTVSVTAEEGFELLAWLRAQASPESVNLEALDADIAQAIRSDDPWIVLDHYELLGLKISKRLH